MQQTRVAWSSLLRSIALAIITVLALLALALWIKSYFQSDTLRWDYGHSIDPAVRRTQLAIQSRRGKIVLGRLDYLPKKGRWQLGAFDDEAYGSVVYRSHALPLDWIGPMDFWSELGFDRRHTISGSWPTIAYPSVLDELTIVTLPHWSLVLVLLPWPVIAYRRWRWKRKWEREGLCRECGYDLQGITSDRCPECGTPTP